MTVRAFTFICFSMLAVLPIGQAGLVAAGEQAGRATGASTSAAASSVSVTTTGDYVIGLDDVLTVVFWRDQTLSGDVLVRPDGKISLPLLDEVPAAGLTPRQLRDRLIVEARRFVTEPVVTVVVKQINSRKVYITGQIIRPGQYPLTSSMTVLQLIATAGGLGDYAKPKDIRVVRVENGQARNLRFDYSEVTKREEKAPSIELKSGDTVVVP
jgi:polysaccharide export outer membrane protein